MNIFKTLRNKVLLPLATVVTIATGFVGLGSKASLAEEMPNADITPGTNPGPQPAEIATAEPAAAPFEYSMPEQSNNAQPTSARESSAAPTIASLSTGLNQATQPLPDLAKLQASVLADSTNTQPPETSSMPYDLPPPETIASALMPETEQVATQAPDANEANQKVPDIGKLVPDSSGQTAEEAPLIENNFSAYALPSLTIDHDPTGLNYDIDPGEATFTTTALGETIGTFEAAEHVPLGSHRDTLTTVTEGLPMHPGVASEPTNQAGDIALFSLGNPSPGPVIPNVNITRSGEDTNPAASSTAYDTYKWLSAVYQQERQRYGLEDPARLAASLQRIGQEAPETLIDILDVESLLPAETIKQSLLAMPSEQYRGLLQEGQTSPVAIEESYRQVARADTSSIANYGTELSQYLSAADIVAAIPEEELISSLQERLNGPGRLSSIIEWVDAYHQVDTNDTAIDPDAMEKIMDLDYLLQWVRGAQEEQSAQITEPQATLLEFTINDSVTR